MLQSPAGSVKRERTIESHKSVVNNEKRRWQLPKPVKLAKEGGDNSGLDLGGFEGAKSRNSLAPGRPEPADLNLATL